MSKDVQADCLQGTDLLLNMHIMAASRTRDARLGLPAILLAAALALVCAAKAAQLDASSTSQPILFDIPAQPLVSALHAFGRRVGVQVLYESRAAVGRSSEAVQGRFTPDEALKRLLAGTDLEIRHARVDAVTLVPLTPPEADLPPISPLTDVDLSIGELRVRATAKPNDLERLSEYSEIVRAEIQRALLKNARTASGNYRAVVDLWIDPARTIRKAALLHPTGEDERDMAITKTLEGLTISRPTPADAPQPIRAAVAVSTSR